MLFALLFGLAATGNPTVTNPGFEERAERSGAMLGWSFTSLPNEPRLVRYRTKAVVSDGQETNALFITVAADHPSKNVAYNAHQDVQGVVAGKTYRVSAKVQTQGLSTLPMIVVQCLDATGGKYLAFARSPERRLSSDVRKWERVETEVTVPQGTAAFRLRIGIPAEGNAGGTAMIDDVEIVEIK